MSRIKQLTETERIENTKKSKKQWRDKNKDYTKKYREIEANKAKHNEECKKYNKTPMGRANILLKGYRRNDKKYERGECTLTSKWIVENIFSSKCKYCGETDWLKLGCDRIDNEKPHTPENVVPCCSECNTKRGSKTYKEWLGVSPTS